jgi:excisionase family DNA binding protein
MVTTRDETDKENFPPDSLRGELRALIDGLREEVSALREEVQSLRRREELDGMDALLNRKEAAERLSISTRTLDDMEEAGEIQAVRIRGRVLYHPETLESYVRRNAGGQMNEH